MKKKILFCFVIITSCCNVEAQWSNNPELANTKVCTEASAQLSSYIISDGSGGAIIFWQDGRNVSGGSNYNNIYYNKLNSAGSAVWSSTSTGLTLTNNTTDYNYIDQVISDGSGGAFISWETDDGVDEELFVQHINSTGAKTWIATGVSLSTTAYSGFICSDNNGGVIITWSDYRGDIADGRPNAYAQRISSAGNKLWAAGGVLLENATGFSGPIGIIPDASGGAIISILDTRNSNYDPNEDTYDNIDIYAQRINASGSPVWAAAGVPVCTQTSNQYPYADGQHPYMVADGAGGALICWEDYRNDANNGNTEPYNEDVFCQRINANGVAQWTANGVLICNASNPQTEISLMPDGTGGAVAVWKDERTNFRMYTQKINGSGAVQWAANGLLVATASNDFDYTASLDAPGASFFVTWADPFNSPQDIRAQKISIANGSLLWGSGTLVCGRSDAQTEPAITHNGGGGAIISWTDQRNNATSSYDIYANRVLAGGVLPVSFLSFEATLQSDYIALSWSTASEINSKEFSVQRSLDGINFETIGNIATAGNSNTLRNYKFDDLQSTRLKVQVIFYRIMETDMDGKSFYTNVKRVKIPEDRNKFMLVYNPVRDEALLNYESMERNVAFIRVTDYLGRVVLTQQMNVIPGANQIKLQTSRLAKGIYEVELKSNRDRGMVRMLKQ